MRTSLLRIALVGLVVTAVGSFTQAPVSAQTTPVYEVEDLGTLPGDDSSVATGINESATWSAGPWVPMAPAPSSSPTRRG